MRRERLRLVVLVIVALLVVGLVLATTADPGEPAGIERTSGSVALQATA